MAKFLALTSRGLIEELKNELDELGFKNATLQMGGVHFESNWEGLYRAHLQSRVATRFLLPILDFPAYKPEDLYFNTQKHDFTKYISTKQTLAVDATVRESAFTDQRFVALKVKDAIVDQFRELSGERPDVEKKTPDLKIYVRVVRNFVSMSVDLTGETLSHRGYRKEAGEAPLAEHLAAALIRISGWKPGMPFIDLMCGSGTIPIEAALMAMNVAPGTLRKGFAFQKLKGFEAEKWDQVLESTLDLEMSETADVGTLVPGHNSENPQENVTLHASAQKKIWGFDISGQMVQISRSNAQRAGVEDWIEWQKQKVTLAENPSPTEKGILLLNPPYGERLGDKHELEDLYRDLAYVLKTHFKGWTCWILAGNRELTPFLKLKATRKVPVFNGPLECRFLRYEIS